MTIDEINMPIFVAAFNLSYDNNKESELSYEELMALLKKETNLLYHMMTETLSSIKK
jgi:hypothetical protein